jgi:hypothetical protein
MESSCNSPADAPCQQIDLSAEEMGAYTITLPPRNVESPDTLFVC